MENLKWGELHPAKGHMCLGRLSQDEEGGLIYPDFIWRLISEYTIDKHRSFSRLLETDEHFSCESCGTLEMVAPQRFIIGYMMDKATDLIITRPFCTKYSMWADGFLTESSEALLYASSELLKNYTYTDRKDQPLTAFLYKYEQQDFWRARMVNGASFSRRGPVITSSEKLRIFSENHEARTEPNSSRISHRSIRRTIAVIDHVYWWPGLVKEVTDLINACKHCAEKTSRQRRFVKQLSLEERLGYREQVERRAMKRAKLSPEVPRTADLKPLVVIKVFGLGTVQKPFIID